MTQRTIKNYTQFVNENLNGGFSKTNRVFEAEGSTPTEAQIKKAIFDLVAYPTTKETYSKLLGTMPGSDFLSSGNSFNLIRDFIVGLSNEAVRYVQITQGEEENMKKGILTIGVKPMIVNKQKEGVENLKYKLSIPTNSNELKTAKNILSFGVEVKELNGEVIPLKTALLLNTLNVEGKYIIANENPANAKEVLERAKAEEKQADVNKILAMWDSSGEVVKRVNNVESKHSSATELLASVPTEQKMQVINSYSPLVKNTLSEGIANFKSKESKEVPDNVAPGKGKGATKESGANEETETNESRNYTPRRNFHPLNEAKSCKASVVKFLKENECEVDYPAGTCKVGTKTMKIEKALLKFKAPASLIKSYSEECSKEINEALRLMRRR